MSKTQTIEQKHGIWKKKWWQLLHGTWELHNLNVTPSKPSFGFAPLPRLLSDLSVHLMQHLMGQLGKATSCPLERGPYNHGFRSLQTTRKYDMKWNTISEHNYTHKKMDIRNIPPGRKWNVVVVSFCIQCNSKRRCVFPHKLGVFILQIPSSCWGFAFFYCIYLNRKLISKKTVILQRVLFLIAFA